MKTSEIRAFRGLMRRIHRQTGASLWGRPCCEGVTVAQGHVLLELHDLKVATLCALAASLRLDKSTTSRTVDALAALGLVAKGRDAADARRAVLRLTPAGRAKVAAIDAAGDENARRILGTVSEATVEEIVRHLGLVADAGDRAR